MKFTLEFRYRLFTFSKENCIFQIDGYSLKYNLILNYLTKLSTLFIATFFFSFQPITYINCDFT